MKKIILLFLLITAFVCMMTGCGDNEVGRLSPQEETDIEKEEKTETFTVSFETDGGTEIKSLTVKKGEKIDKPENPTKTSTATEEYEFNGWFIGDKEWIFSTDVVSGDVTLTAKWSVKKYSKDLPL